MIGLITPTPETEVSLDDVLDPFSQTVSTKNDGTPFDPKNIDELFALLKPPACAISGVSYVCGQTPSATPPVGEELTTLSKGDVLGIYDYTVLVTEVSNGSSPFTGKGLVKLPFAGGIKVPVEFKGIKAKKGEDGTHGGCVWYVPADLNEGYFQVKGSQQDAIVKEQEKFLADIYSELIDPQSFYGTFEEALAKYEEKRKAIQAIEDAGGKARKEDYQELTKNLRGIVQGGKDWKEKLLKHFGTDANKPENKAILDKLDALKAALLACEKCVADNLSTPPPKTGGGGPMGFEDWEVNLAKCVYPDAKGVIDEAVALLNPACNCVVGECSDILTILDQIKDANASKQKILTITKPSTTQNNHLENYGSWSQIATGIDVEGICFKLGIDFNYAETSKKLNPTSYKEVATGIELYNDEGLKIMTISLPDEAGQGKYFKIAVLKRYLKLTDEVQKDILTIKIFSDGRVVRFIPKKIKDAYKKQFDDMSYDKMEFPVQFIYYDATGNEKKIGEYKYFMTENKYPDESKYGTHALIDLINIRQFANSSDFTFTINTSRYYPNLSTMGSFIGTMINSSYSDFTFNGCSNEEGLSIGGSKSHKNGYNCDIRYLRKNNEIASSSICNEDYKNIDISRQENINSILDNFGWHYLLSNHSKIELLKTHNDPDGNHCDHLHVQSYSNFKEEYEK